MRHLLRFRAFAQRKLARGTSLQSTVQVGPQSVHTEHRHLAVADPEELGQMMRATAREVTEALFEDLRRETTARFAQTLEAGGIRPRVFRALVGLARVDLTPDEARWAKDYIDSRVRRRSA